MFEVSIENEYGERLDFAQSNNFIVYQVDGLDPPTANINTSPVANFDGARYNSSRVNVRNIVVYLTIERDCEASRIELYRYVKSKRPVRFYYKNASRDVFIDGHVEGIQIAFFDEKQKAQISILCPYPYFKSKTENSIEFATLDSKFVFPFAYEESGEPFSSLEFGQTFPVVNVGDIECGAIITLRALDHVLNPVIYNFSKNEYFKINWELLPGDEVIINTNKGNKRVTLTHEGATTNIINKIERGSTWMQLICGDNLISYGADEFPENLLCSMTFCDEFEGV